MATSESEEGLHVWNLARSVASSILSEDMSDVGEAEQIVSRSNLQVNSLPKSVSDRLEDGDSVDTDEVARSLLSAHDEEDTRQSTKNGESDSDKTELEDLGWNEAQSLASDILNSQSPEREIQEIPAGWDIEKRITLARNSNERTLTVLARQLLNPSESPTVDDGEEEEVNNSGENSNGDRTVTGEKSGEKCEQQPESSDTEEVSLSDMGDLERCAELLLKCLSDHDIRYTEVQSEFDSVGIECPPRYASLLQVKNCHNGRQENRKKLMEWIRETQDAKWDDAPYRRTKRQ